MPEERRDATQEVEYVSRGQLFGVGAMGTPCLGRLDPTPRLATQRVEVLGPRVTEEAEGLETLDVEAGHARMPAAPWILAHNIIIVGWRPTERDVEIAPSWEPQGAFWLR